MKIMNSIFEIWPGIMLERAIACAFNLEDLLTGGHDLRWPAKSIFPAAGAGATVGTAAVTTTCFGTHLQAQPVENQERGSPILTDEYQILTVLARAGTLARRRRRRRRRAQDSTLRDADRTVISYICDRERAVVWGINGGLPSMPHGLTLQRAGEAEQWLGSVFSDVPLRSGDTFSRPTAGGGGCGEPLQRDLVAVREGATWRERDHQRAHRRAWCASIRRLWPRASADGIDAMDAIRRRAVLIDWQTGALLPESTRQVREMFGRRSAAHWRN